MNRKILISVALASAVFFGGCSYTQPKVEEASPKVVKMIKDHKLEVVEFDYVKKAIAKGTKSSASAILIDARPNPKYKKGTIPTSINIPDTQYSQYIGQLKDVAKNKEIIVFCGGWKCGKSPKVALMLKKDGYTNVKLYQSGEPQWAKMSYSEIDISIAKGAVEKNAALMVDARPYAKFLKETIPGSLGIPDTKLDELIGRFPINKSENIIIFCGGFKCGKSHKIANKLVSLGYTNVSVFAGGVPQWKEQGLSTTSGKGSLTNNKKVKKEFSDNGIKIGADEGSVDGEWFYSLYSKGKVPSNVQIVDVTDASNFKVGHMKGAIHIESENMDIKDVYAKFPKGKSIVMNCASGGRALDTWMRLSDAKYDMSEIFYFDANVDCKGSDCKIEVNEPIE